MAPKKGKEKAAANRKPTPAPSTSTSSTFNAKGKSNAAKKPKDAPAEDDSFIVFTNSDKEPKKKGGASKEETIEGLLAPPKPTVKQIIGGSSWTGKTPVNLLSEHCQKLHWERPHYVTREQPQQPDGSPGGFLVTVSLSAKKSKTDELTRLPPFQLPSSHLQSLGVRPTVLEAKHAAATLALYRVCSMKNMHMTLPPDYRTLWKELEALKKKDVKEGRACLYDANPFRVFEEMKTARAAAEKKAMVEREAREREREAQKRGGGMPVQGGRGGNHANFMRGWTTAPRIEMGNRTRAQLEEVLRRETVWNPYGLPMGTAQKQAIARELGELGFRASHVQEAVEECKDREETLEWLLLHVPEDDLPRWALPEKYTAGVTVAATDLRREGAAERLARSGYSADLCRKVLDAHGGDEGQAAEALQNLLLASGGDGEAHADPEDRDEDSSRSSDECWEDEVVTLEASFGAQFSRPSPDVCQIRLESVVNGRNANVEAYLQFRKSPRYPAEIILSVISSLPAYIKLSIIKRALVYSQESLAGQDTKIYFVTSWVQENINNMIENPGALRDVAAVASAASEEPTAAARRRKTRRAPRHPRPIDWTPNRRSTQEWQARRECPEYKKMVEQRERLPAWKVQDEVVRTVAENQVTIISGETGSGKSTQSVQFLLDDMYARGLGLAANMVVTQPRRISALGLADRVSEERCSPVGHEVGYSIRGESRTSPHTRITFVTTGVLLRRLQTSGGSTQDVVAALADVSHVVIDEVHERSLDTDFLLSILRDVLYERKDLKLVLMSATLDAATFKDYFAADGRNVSSVGMVEIAGRTYPVEDYYLDDIIRMTGFSIETKARSRYNRPRDDNSRCDDDGDKTRLTMPLSEAEAAKKTIQKLGSRINYDLVLETVQCIDEHLSATQKPSEPGGILIFLPGVGEIARAVSVLRSLASLHVVPLHASLETREQRKIFVLPPPGKRKVVVATNVAETSITIDDIVAVVDSGRVKESSFDPATNMRRLDEAWASRAACKQRRGRAGRVQEGTCYKLFTRGVEETQMAERPDPEMRRVPLEQLCLGVRAMGVRDVAHFLSRAPAPPDVSAIKAALDMLRRTGVLDGDELTALGRQLALLPADLRCGKLMVLGALFGCLDECVTMAALLNARSPFLSPAERREEAKAAKMRVAQRAPGGGDLLTDLRAFQEWGEEMRLGGQRGARAFCDEHFLSFGTLNDVASTRSQYYASLQDIGISPQTPSSANSPSSAAMLRALTAAAFTPQIARIQFPDKKFATSVSGTVELDPEARTIKYFTQARRVFVHPGSVLFDAQAYGGGMAFLSYFNMVATTKAFVRDLTPFNAYTLLLFAGTIELDTQGRGLVVDGWLRLRGWARIGVLVSRLRGVMDRLIASRIEGEDAEAGGVRDAEAVIRVVRKLVELDGLDA